MMRGMFEDEARRRHFWKFFGIFLLMIFLGLAAQVAIGMYVKNKTENEKFSKAENALNRLDEALKNDTYGGKTPQETLNMFVDALKKGDVELASKYFELDTNTQSPDYLTRRKWEEVLVQAKNEGRLPQIIDLLRIINPAGSSVSGYFGFEARDEKGNLIDDISMHLNDRSNIWKIQSL